MKTFYSKLFLICLFGVFGNQVLGMKVEELGTINDIGLYFYKSQILCEYRYTLCHWSERIKSIISNEKMNNMAYVECEKNDFDGYVVPIFTALSNDEELSDTLGRIVQDYQLKNRQYPIVTLLNIAQLSCYLDIKKKDIDVVGMCIAHAVTKMNALPYDEQQEVKKRIEDEDAIDTNPYKYSLNNALIRKTMFKEITTKFFKQVHFKYSNFQKALGVLGIIGGTVVIFGLWKYLGYRK